MARCRECGTVREGSKAPQNGTNGHLPARQRDSDSDVSLIGFDLESMMSTSEIVISGSPTTHDNAPAARASESHSAPAVSGPGEQPPRDSPGLPPAASLAAEESAQPVDPSRVSMACGQCGRTINTPKSLAGKRIKCPTCGTPAVVPGGSSGSAGACSALSASFSQYEVRTRLAAAIRTALSATTGKREPAPAAESTLSGRALRKLERALVAIEGQHTSTAALETAGQAISRLIESADPRAGELLLQHLDRLPQLRRMQAVRGLGELKVSGAFEPLLKLLGEDDDVYTPAALAALGALGDPRAVPALLATAALVPEQRVRALDAITAIGTGALPPLQAALQADGDGLLRFPAVEALGRIKDARTLPLLSQFAKDPDPELRRLAVEAISNCDAPTVLRPLAAALTDSAEPVRLVAATRLARLPEKRLVPFLMRAVSDSSREVRLLVVQALGKCGDDSALRVLRPLVTCGDGDMELEAAEAVARLGDHAAVPRLLEKLEFAARLNGDEPQALKMIDALRRIKDDRAVLPLIDLLGHRSDRIRSRAAEALGQIGDRTAGGPIADLFDRERSPLVMASAAKALGDLKDRAGLTALQAALQHSDPVRIKAVIALGEIGGMDALEMAAGRLGDPSAQVRYQAVTVLGRSGKKEFAAQLAPLIDDADEMVRRAALKALEELGDDRTEAEIRKSLGKKGRTRSNAPKRSSRSLHDLVPTHMLGLMSPRLVAIGGGVLAVVAVVVALAWWRPFASTASDNVPRGRVKSLSLAGDGTTLVAGRTLRLIEIWDVDGKQRREALSSILGDQVAFDASGSRLLCCDSARSALYDLNSGQVLAEETGIKALAVNLRLTRAATQTTDGRIIIWNLESGQIDSRLQFDRPDTTALAVAADGRFCAVGTMRGEVFVTDIAEGAVVREIQTPDRRAVQSLAFNPGRSRVAIGTSTGEILLSDIEGTAAPQKLGEPGGPVAYVMFLDDVRILSIRGESLEVWDTAGGTVESASVALATINGVGVSPDGRRVAVGSIEETPILVYDLTTLEQIAELDVR